MNRGWRDYTALKGGESGARASFEHDCKQLLKKIHPGKQVDTIRANPGDDGIDIYVGNIGQEPILVYQCKFFLDEFGDAQKQQIRESFNTAIYSDTYTMSGWYLLVPYQEFDMAQSLWLEKWKQRQREKHHLSSNFIQVINGNELIALMKAHDTYNGTFEIQQLLNSEVTMKLVKDIYKSVLPAKAENSTQEKEHDLVTIKEIFDITYNEGYEKYYVERQIDSLIHNSLKFHKNIWVFGESGIGKTTSITRILNNKGIPYHYCYLTAVVSAENVESIFEDIAEDLTEKYIPDPSILNNNKNIIKRLVDIISKANFSDIVVIHIDEITVANEQVFSTFVNNLIALSQKYSFVNKGNRSIKFIVSTIQTPIQFCENKTKAKEIFDFIENETWDESDLKALLDKIIISLSLEIDIVDMRTLLKSSKGSPRRLKGFLYFKVMNPDKSYDSIVNIYTREIE